MVIAGIPIEEIRHTRAVQDWLAEGSQEGKAQEAAKATLRQLNRHCGPLERGHHRPDPGAATGAAGIIGPWLAHTPKAYTPHLVS